MPTYEYRCPDGHDFERFYRKISDAPSDVACPVCGKIAERRMSAGAGFAFKGSGFYLTDYGRNAHRTSGPAAKGEGGKGEGGKGEGGKRESGASSSGDSGSSSSATPSTPAASEAKTAAKSEAKP